MSRPLQGHTSQRRPSIGRAIMLKDTFSDGETNISPQMSRRDITRRSRELAQSINAGELSDNVGELSDNNVGIQSDNEGGLGDNEGPQSHQRRSSRQQGNENHQENESLDGETRADVDEEILLTEDDITYVSNEVDKITNIKDVPQANILLRGLIHYKAHIANVKNVKLRYDSILKALPTREEFERKKNIFLLILLHTHKLGGLYIEFQQNKNQFRGFWSHEVTRDKNAWKNKLVELEFESIPLPDVKSFEKYMKQIQKE
jgi:hypothetical protein